MPIILPKITVPTAVAVALVGLTVGTAWANPEVPAIVPINVTMAAATAGTAANEPGLTQFKNAIRAKYDLKEKAFAEHDAEAILTRFYASDAITAGPEGVAIGREQLRAKYLEAVKHYTVKVESVHTYVNGDAGWDWSNFHLTPVTAGQKPITVIILFLWTKIDGKWMCKGEFYNVGSFPSAKQGPAKP